MLQPIEFASRVNENDPGHHEHWTTRLSARLQGEDIPLASRILALVDAFEAMTLGRPYATRFRVRSAGRDPPLLRDAIRSPRSSRKFERLMAERRVERPTDTRTRVSS